MKLKKMLAGTLAAAMTFMCVVQPFSAEGEASTEDGIDYLDYSDYIIITGYHGSEEKIVIPEEINGKPVQDVNINYWKYSCKSITIPSTARIYPLTYPSYPDMYDYFTLEEINVDEENSRYTSENGILYDKDKKELVAYPPRKNDKAYTMPDTVKSLDTGAFQNNPFLETITVSENFLGYFSVYNLPNLKSIDVAEGNKYVTSIDGVLFRKDSYYGNLMSLIAYPSGNLLIKVNT